MGKNKGSRITITLECECRNKEYIKDKRKNGICRYTTSKNKRNTPSRLKSRSIASTAINIQALRK